MTDIERAVRAAERPVALTGAGISAPSGIPTFQGSWKGAPIRDFLSRDYFNADPAGFYELFCDMAGWCDRPPNAAHMKLAEWGIPVITQNIDGLHTRAGSGDVIELHGSLRFVICRKCRKRTPASEFAAKLKPLYKKGDIAAVNRAIHCDCGALINTDVVLYGDDVRGIDRAMRLAQSCDLMLVVGTSLETYPAAALPDIARYSGAKILMVNTDCVRELCG